MNHSQIKVIGEVMRFLTSPEFTIPYDVEILVTSCNKQLKKLDDAGIEPALRNEIKNIFEEEIYRYI